MAKRAAELKRPAVALTDHGNVHGAVEFYKACKAAGVKPIIGVEGYVAPGSRTSREPGERQPYHITMLAQTQTGYRNLLKLVTTSHLEGFYYRPRVDRETLAKHSEGLIVLSGCPSAELPRRLSGGQVDEANEVAGWYKEVFGGRYYLELMRHDGVPGLTETNRGIVELSKRTGVPLVVTNDSHYVLREDSPLQDILTCIQTNTNVNDGKRLKMDADSFYLKSAAEMATLWPDQPDALKNTLAIAEQCDAGPEFGKAYVPRFRTPKGETSMEYVRALCAEGVQRKFGANPLQAVHDRLQYELEVIEKTNFADYFLVVWDIFKFVNSRGILSAVRGSAAASLVLYCLDVTEIDPLATRLVFERFLNLERKEMPDIDMDFQDDRREEVIRYCVDRYGREHVAQIITFGTLGARAAVRDVSRALGFDVSVGDKLAKAVPFRLNMTLEQALTESPDLSAIVENDDKSRQVMEIARKLEGAVRHASTHAAGVVISDKPLTDYVALQRSTSGDDTAPPTTQFAMGPVADVGLLKMDFLGLTNLTILDRAIKLIASQRGERVRLTEIPTSEAVPAARVAYDLLSSAETFGVFQLEGAGMRRYIKELKPNSVNDVAAMIALYRPGPMEHITTFIEAKHGRQAVMYPHPALRDILDETYGVIVYQDQVLLIAREFGGYTLGEADILRKAMGKKIPEVMAAQREKFVAGAIAKGYSDDLATTIFNLIEPFAGYAFNKAHSMSYAMIAYWTAYFKANYAVEYFTSVMNAFISNPEKAGEAVLEAKRQQIEVLPPDVNRSAIEFSVEAINGGAHGIRYGLAAVKNVGATAVTPLIAARDAGGSFKTLEEFCSRVDFKGMNKRTLESLIKVGTLDIFGSRAALLEAAERITGSGQRQAKLRDSGQTTMFDLFGQSVQTPSPEIRLIAAAETSERERSLWEKELLGVELTQSAFTREMYAQQDGVIVFTTGITPELAGRKVSVLGQVAAIRQLSTKKGDRFISVNLALIDGQVELVVWRNVLERSEALWVEGKQIALTGTVRERDGRVSVAVDEAREYVMPGARQPDGSLIGAISEVPVLSYELAPDSFKPVESALDAGSGNDDDSESVTEWPNRQDEGSGLTLSTAHDGLGSAPTPQAGLTKLGANGHVNNTRPGNGSAAAAPQGASLVVKLTETGQVSEDKFRLEDVVRLLLEFRGESPVYVEVATRNGIVRLEMQRVKVDPCEQLTGRLVDLLGPGSVSITSGGV